MRLLKNLTLLAAVLVTLPVSAQVVVHSAGQSITFKQPVRLDAVLAPLVRSADIYWPAAALYDTNAPEAEQLRRQTLNLLQELQQSAQPEVQQVLLQLANSIRDWRLAKRLPFVIDYDLARINLAANPLLPTGDYILQLPRRPDSVVLIGAISGGVVTQPHTPATAVNDYLQRAKLQFADTNNIQLLQADGRLIQVPLSGASAAYQEAQPGAVLYVPFRSLLFSRDYQRLNQLLVELMQYRVAV